MQQLYKGLFIPKALYKAPAEPRKIKPEPGRQGKIKYPDELILQIRTMHEIEGKSHKAVAAQFPDIPEAYVRNILDYVVRGNLILKKK